MTARIAHLRNPIAPHLNMRTFELEPGVPVTAAIAAAGWKLPKSTFLVRRDIAELEIDWAHAKPSEIFVKRSEWDAEPLNDNETLVLVTLPQNGGGGAGSQILEVVAMIAVLALAWYLAPLMTAQIAGAIGTTSLTVAQGIYVASFLSVMIGGQLLLSLILPHPKAPPRPKQQYQIGVQSNQARLGQPVPERFGRNCFAPDLRSQPYIEYDENAESTFSLFCLGVGSYYVEQIRIGTNVIAQADEYGNLQPTGNYPEITWQLVPPNGTFNLFPDNVVTSTEVSSIEMLGKNQLNYQWTAWFVANPPNTETTLIAFDMIFPGGLYSVGDNGNVEPCGCKFEFEAQLIDDVGNVLGAPFVCLGVSITLATNQPQRLTWEANVPCGRYQVRGIRLTGIGGGNEPADTLLWGSLRSFLPNQGTYGNCTMLGIMAKASYNLSQLSSDQFNVVATRILTTPVEIDGVWQWSAAPQATRSIAAAANYLLSSSNCADLDPSTYDGNWLLSYEALWQSRGDTFDGGYDTQGAFYDQLNECLNCGRAQALPGPFIGFARDEAKSVYRCAFSPRTMLKDTFSIDYVFFDPNNNVDAVTVTYLDETNWTPAEMFISMPGSNYTQDTAPKQNVTTMVSRAQVWREWNYKLAASYYRRVMPSFQTELDGRVCYRGDLVKLNHVMASWGASADVLFLEENDAGDILTLSEPWTLAGAGAPMMELTTQDGYLCSAVEISIIDDGDVNSTSSPNRAIVQLLENPVPPQGKYMGLAPREWGIWGLNDTDQRRDLQRERPKALLGLGTDTAVDALVVSMAPQQGLKCQVVCVVDNPLVYTADEVAVPPYITGSCDGGNANLTVTSLEIHQTTGSYPDGMDCVLNVEVFGAPDASSFDYQYSVAGGAWQGPFTGNPRTFTFRSFFGFMQLQVRAEGAGKDGNWYEIDFEADGHSIVGLGLDFRYQSNSQYLPLLFSLWS